MSNADTYPPGGTDTWREGRATTIRSTWSIRRWKEMSIATTISYHMETVMASRDTAAFMALLPRAFLWQVSIPSC